MESRDYLKDDCVRFRCRIVVLTRQAQAPLIEDGVAQLSKRNPRADVLIQVGNDKVFAHKWLLAASSPVLCSRLSDPLHFSKGLFVIPDVEPVLFKTMLHFMYTGKLEEDGEEFVSYAGPFVLDLFIGKVLAAAYQFKMEKLKKCCESRILSKLSVKSVAYLLHLADVCCAAELKAACFRFAAENLDAVLDSEGCKYLRKSCPSLYEDLAPRGILGWEFRVTSKILSAIEPFVGLMTTLLLEAIPEE
ncbi:BTB/POZ and MATH domain-containing protein 4 [Striga hermonthica]|uniref:BTB/POZ and MATH domain-containing protein 4 n=1 Tax=Striga hermonthica TaxID=68872 RepID=A0A9N7RBD2_STRHE|nr:BTB/POZ and MATH domain-containing protein 4 [Striga hermonthica]